MRNENIETTELTDAELDGVAGGVLNDAMGQLGVADVADLGGVGTDLGGVGVGGLNVAPQTGFAPQTGLSL